jgi:hypothetical protein
MAIHFVCPSGHPLSAEDHLAGTLVRCGECRETVIVPPAEKDSDPRALRQRWRDRRRRKPEESEEQPDLTAATAAATAQPALKPERKPMRRIERARPTLSADVYRPDARRIAAVNGLALALAAIVAFSLLPLLTTGEENMATAPGWARAALLVAVVQAVYIVWMVAAPDWSSVWVLMVVFAVSAAGYAAAAPIAAFAPPEKLAALGMPNLTRFAAGWCACVMLTLSLGTYLCGRLATRWRRAFEMEAAARNRLPRSG